MRIPNKPTLPRTPGPSANDAGKAGKKAGETARSTPQSIPALLEQVAEKVTENKNSRMTRLLNGGQGAAALGMQALPASMRESIQQMVDTGNALSEAARGGASPDHVRTLSSRTLTQARDLLGPLRETLDASAAKGTSTGSLEDLRSTIDSLGEKLGPLAEGIEEHLPVGSGIAGIAVAVIYVILTIVVIVVAIVLNIFTGGGAVGGAVGEAVELAAKASQRGVEWIGRQSVRDTANSDSAGKGKSWGDSLGDLMKEQGDIMSLLLDSKNRSLDGVVRMMQEQQNAQRKLISAIGPR